MVDNIELCDKNIFSFVDFIKEIHIPIILISNAPILRHLFLQDTNCTFIEFKHPSLLELTKLVIEINCNENLNLTKENIKSLIEKSQYDIRQLFHILQQWVTYKSHSSFTDFIDNQQEKHTDLDLDEKLLYLFNNKYTFDTNNSFNLALTDPIVISHSIYQNYLNASSEIDPDIMDNISYSNIISNKIFDEQCWDLYHYYTMSSCVIPSYHIKKQDFNNFNIEPFRDISYNYTNSYKDIRSHISKNAFHYHPSLNNIETCFFTAQMFVNYITTLNAYFEKQKKGKNTSKQEKISMCKNISDPNISTILSYLIMQVYEYTLYEIHDEFVVNKHLYIAEEHIHTRLDKIDIRMLKRFINIFTFTDTSKLIKSHVELIIKYNLILKLRERLIAMSPKFTKHTVEDLTQELSDIWNF